MWNHKELKINSLQTNLALVERFVEEICDENYISDSYFGNIMLALEEAVKNAIVHGNKLNPARQVLIACERKRGGIFFAVEDEGGGFDPASVPSPLDSETAGKGLFLIRSLADRVEFNAPGNRISLSFSVSCINQETTLKRISSLKKYFRKQTTFA